MLFSPFICVDQTGGYVFKIHVCAPRHTSLWLSLYHEVTGVQTMEVHADEYSKAESKFVIVVFVYVVLKSLLLLTTSSVRLVTPP